MPRRARPLPSLFSPLSPSLSPLQPLSPLLLSLLILSSLLFPLFAAPASAFDAYIMDGSQSVANLTFEESEDEDLLERCFLPGAQYRALTGSRLVFGAGDTTSATYELTGAEAPAAGTSFEGALRDTNATSSPATPRRDELIYRQLLDAEGRPLGGVTVVIEWRDSLGRTQRYLTETLSREEALRLGDAGLEGYYFVSRDRLGGAEFTARPLASELDEETPAANLTPEPLAATPQGNAEVPIKRVPVETAPPNRSRAFFAAVGAAALAFLARFWLILLLLIITAALLGVYHHRLREAVQAALLTRRRPKGARVRRFLAEDAKQSMRREFVAVPKGASLRDALNAMLVADESYCLVTDSGVLLGVITPADAMHDAEGDPAKVRAIDVMAAPATTVDIGSSLGDAIARGRDARVLPVLRGGTVAGVILREDLLGEIDRFFALNPFTVQVPTVAKLIEPAATADLRAPVGSLLAAAREAPGMLLSDRGVIREREMLEEICNYKGLLSKMEAAPLLKPAPRSVSPEVSVLDANRIMLELGVRALPVTGGAGLVTQRAVLRALDSALRSVHQHV